MSSKERLIELKNKSCFTEGLTLDEFLRELAIRFLKIFDEILRVGDYDYIVSRLEDKGFI